MFERLTDRARMTMALANQEAQRFNHEYIGTEHILLGLVNEGWGVAANVLKKLNIDLDKVRLEVEKLMELEPDAVTLGKLPQTPRAKNVIEYAIEEARSLNHSYVGTEHLLLGLLREGQGLAWQALHKFGLTFEKAQSEVMTVLAEGGADDGSYGGPTEPFQPPEKLSLLVLPHDPGMAYLANDRGNQISPPMRIELANEIVKRYNAH